MSVNKYTGTLTIKVRGQEETANVVIFPVTRAKEAGGGWECLVTVEFRGAKHQDSFYLPDGPIRERKLTDGLQGSVARMPAPLQNVNVRRAGFVPQLVKH